MGSTPDDIATQIAQRQEEVRNDMLSPPPPSKDEEAAALLVEQDNFGRRLLEAENAIAMYDSSRKTTGIAAESFLAILNDYTNTVKELAETDTFSRKSYFLNMEYDSVVEFSAYATLFLWANAVVFGKIALYEKRDFKNVKVWVVLLLLGLSPIVVSKLVQGVMSIPRPVNIYTTWAESGNKEWHGDDPY